MKTLKDKINKHNKAQVSNVLYTRTSCIVGPILQSWNNYKPSQLEASKMAISERTLQSTMKILHYISNNEISLSWFDTSWIPEADISETKEMLTRNNKQLPRYSQNPEFQWPMPNSTLKSDPLKTGDNFTQSCNRII